MASYADRAVMVATAGSSAAFRRRLALARPAEVAQVVRDSALSDPEALEIEGARVRAEIVRVAGCTPEVDPVRFSDVEAEMLDHCSDRQAVSYILFAWSLAAGARA